MSMTNEELRHAIEDANKLARSTHSSWEWYVDVVKHLRALMVEQQRRAVAQQELKEPSSPAPAPWASLAPAVSPYPIYQPPHVGAPRPIDTPWVVTCKGAGSE
jgi:hypothetical protein